jgi:hypothetical protein
MNDALLASVVHALRFSSNEAARGAERHPSDFTKSAWTRQFGVLDRTGLTLPFYARLLANGGCGGFPVQVIAALEQRRIDNGARMQGMLQRFATAALALQYAGVRFVCLKGFSLFPEYHDEPWQRHQVDFDLLIAPHDGPRCQAALERIGYRLAAIARDGERRLRIPVSRSLGRDAYLYAPQEGGAIELHSTFWEAGAEDFPLRCPEDAFEQAEPHQLNGVSFLRLSRPHQFLYQVLHVFRHFMGSWARLLWLYEISSYLYRYREDNPLWRKVHALIAEDPRLREASALVLLAAKDLFVCPIPAALESVCSLPARSPVRLWIDRYARRWLSADMPGNKLNLLLHRHFISDRRAWRRYLTARLAPWRERPRLCEGLEPLAAKSIAFRAANLRFQAGRALHHLRTGAGFALASPGWEIHLRSKNRGLAPNAMNRGAS